MNNRQTAGLILLLLAIMHIGIWIIFITVSNPADVTWLNNLKYLMSTQNEISPFFYASILSAVFSFFAGITYFSKASTSKQVLLLLLLLCVVQAIPAIWFLGWDLKAIYSATMLFSYLAYKNPNKSFKFAHKKRGLDAAQKTRRAP